MNAILERAVVTPLLDVLTEAVLLTDQTGTLVFANAAARARFDLDRYQGMPLEKRLAEMPIFRPDGTPLPPGEDPVVRALSIRMPAGSGRVMLDGRGERRWYVINTSPVFDGDRLAGTASVFHDVTAAVRDETHAREAIEAARRTAEDANRLKDQFINTLSHELRAPLQPILGWTEVLRRHGRLDEVTTRAVEAIRRNIRQQVRLVDDLLDFSRLVNRNLHLRHERFDLREPVRAGVEPFEEAASLKRVRLSVELPPAPLLMWGDGSRIQQVVGNLVSNALKFTPEGGVVHVRVAAEAPGVLVEVEDTGDGIAADDLGVIFDVFRQAARSRAKGGMGLGLALVKQLTEMHGGTVEAFSAGAGLGARFRLRLPLAAPLAPALEPARGTRRLEQRSILVVEDNLDTREVLRVMLELEGATVATAESGHDAVRSLETLRPDVVLCDIGLPDIDGFEVARRIRREAGLENTRLIALTGYGRTEDVQQALDAGFETHLTKPVNLDELLARLA
jgi:two-component system CheB/CheR fusion protein